MFSLGKFSLIITTRCNLKCKLCCEYVPQNKAFPDMTADEGRAILDAFFAVVDHVDTLHLTGGGEPFLNPQFSELVNTAMEYADKFDRLMLFSNSTISIKPEYYEVILRHKEKIVVQLSQYGVAPEKEAAIEEQLMQSGITCKVEKYYGDEQSFGGWVDFGPWEAQGKSAEELERTFKSCSVTRVLQGNWRTRDGKVHWCSRSQRGMELGFLPDNPDDYVDLFDISSVTEKRDKYEKIAGAKYISACDRCSGDAGTLDSAKRYPAAEQI